MRICLVLLLSLAPAAGFAEEVVFYRCTDAAGALTVQNMPCPKGHNQERRVMQGIATVPMTPATPRMLTPAPPPAPTPASTSSAAASSAQAVAEPATDTSAKIDDAKRLPPPILFQCTTYDNDRYLTEESEAKSRCRTLRTVGLDGNPQTGAGEACEVVQDRCARVPDGALCDAWKKRRDETEVAWRFARPENIDKNKVDFDRVDRIVKESTCSVVSTP